MINSYVAIDLETTGVDPSNDKIIEIGAIKIVDGIQVDTYAGFVNPQTVVPARITEITGITDEMVTDAPVIEDIIGDIIEFIGDLPLLGHNVKFDYSFLKVAAVVNGYVFEKDGIDTLRIARACLPELESKKLDFLCGHFGIDPGNSHRALDDACSAKVLYEKLCALVVPDNLEDKLIKLEYSPKKKSPITAAQLKYLGALANKYRIALDVNPEELTKSEASRIIDRIILEYGK